MGGEASHLGFHGLQLGGDDAGLGRRCRQGVKRDAKLLRAQLQTTELVDQLAHSELPALRVDGRNDESWIIGDGCENSEQDSAANERHHIKCHHQEQTLSVAGVPPMRCFRCGKIKMRG